MCGVGEGLPVLGIVTFMPLQTRCKGSIALGLLLLSAARAAQPVDGAAIDRIVQKAMEAQPAPGMAIAIVRDGELVYTKGYGLRKMGASEPVTPDTIFAIGSLTKAFTTAAMAMLVEDGRMSWDDPVQQHLPYFRLKDPIANATVTLRDLVTHRTGLAGHDMLWMGAPWPLEESIRRIGLVDPSAPIRTRYQYQNLMYNAAGEALAHTAGVSWDEFVRERIFVPLGMSHAVFASSEAQRARDHATPHRPEENGKSTSIAWYNDDRQVRPAGSIKTSVRDLSRWMLFQLGDGTFHGRRLLSAKSLQEMHRGQMALPPDMPNDPPSSYAMGWVVQSFHGQLLLSHGGAVRGFRAFQALIPARRLGVVALTNLDSAWIQEAVTMQILDELTNATGRDWFDEFREAQEKTKAAAGEARRKRAAQRQPNTKTSLDLTAYAGAYRNPAYGLARVSHGRDGLTLDWSSFELPLRHYHYDTFDLVADAPMDAQQAVFHLGASGTVDEVRFLDTTFRRIAPESLLHMETLASRIVDALHLQPGERVLMRYDPNYFQDLAEPLRTRIRARDAIDLPPLRAGDPIAANQLESADVFLWLPLAPTSPQYSAQDRKLLAEWLEQGGTRREIHFHWSDGSRRPDGLPGTHTLDLDAMYRDALDIDYAELNARQQRAIEIMRLGTTRVSTPEGTDLMFRVGTRPFNIQNGDASGDRARRARVRVDREIELPAGVLRVAPAEESVSGIIVLPEARFGDTVAKRVSLIIDSGKITAIRAESGQAAVESALRTAGEGAMRFREFALGFNPKLAVTRGETVPYYGYGAGVVRFSLGDNEELGGKVRGGFTRWFFLSDATVHVDFRYLVRYGRLLQ